MESTRRGHLTFARVTAGVAALALLAACTGTAGTALIAPVGPGPSATARPAPDTSPSTSPPPTDAPAASARPALDLPKLPDIVSPEPVPANRTDQLSQAMGAAGTVTFQQAVDVYSLSVAPLAGSTPFTLPAGGGFSPTTADALVEHFRDQLTPAQVAVVDARQRVTPIGTANNQGQPITVAAPGGLRSPGRALVTPAKPPAPQPIAGERHLMSLLEATISDWHAKHPELIGLVGAVNLAVSSTDMPIAGAPDAMPDMDAQPTTTTRNGCLITVHPAFLRAKESDAEAKLVFAHELFHCIQFTWADTAMLPDWLIEGSAEWAAMDLYRNTATPTMEDFIQWFTNPGTPLGQEGSGQGYNAWPLFEAFQEQFGTSPYPSVQAMITAGGDTENLLDAGGMDGPIFAQLWSSSSIRSTIFPEEVFHLNWPSTAPDFPSEYHDLLVPEDARGLGSFSITVKGAFRHLSYSLPFTGDVGLVGVSSDGGGLLTRDENGPATVADGDQRWFCVQADGCTCPDGSQATVDLTDVTGPMLLSFPAQAADTTANLDDLAWDPDRYCSQDPPADSTGSTGPAGPSGTSDGDPHVTTFDGLLYDFMTLGEFVAAQDRKGGFTVQERHQPASFGTTISAVAIGDGSHRITFTAAEAADGTGLDRAAPITVRTDGTTVAAKTFSVGGLSVTASSVTFPADEGTYPSWTVSWPDRSAVQLIWDGGGFSVTVQPSAARARGLVGILGRPSGDYLDDLSMPNGSPASPAAGYLSFAQAWWVTDATSLFDYSGGQRTETFRVAPPARPPVSPPSESALTSCHDGLGQHATAGEIHECAFDLTALDPTAADTQTVVGQYRAGVDHRQDLVQQEPPAQPAPPLVVVGATSSTPASTGSPGAPTSAPVTTGSLTLDATFPVDPVGPDPEHPLLPPHGTMHLVQGTVLLVQVNCPVGMPDFDLSVVIGIALTHGSKDNGNSGLCGELWRLDAMDSPAGTERHVGETELLVETTGDYQVELQNETGSDLPAPLQMTAQFTADPSPLVVTGAIPTSGISKTLATGSSMVVMLSPGPQGGTWAVDGGGTACVQLRYLSDVFSRPSSPVDLEGVCPHHTQVSIPRDTESFPLIVFNRAGPAIPVTVRRIK